MHAKQYIDTVMSNIQKQVEDEQIFPTKFGKYSIWLSKSNNIIKVILMN